jgi:hypothetical protein
MYSSTVRRHRQHFVSLTDVSRLVCDFREQLNEVWEVFLHELCAKQDCFSGAVRVDLRTEQLGLANDADGESPPCVLFRQPTSQRVHQTHPEGKFLQRFGKTRNPFVARARLRNQRQAGRGAGQVPADQLDASGLRGLEIGGARNSWIGSTIERAMVGRRTGVAAALRTPDAGTGGRPAPENGSREHFGRRRAN